MGDRLRTRSSLRHGNKTYRIFDLSRLVGTHPTVATLPFSLKILLENLLRHEGGQSVRPEDIDALLAWTPDQTASVEIAFHPSRVVLQDFTGVPAIVDLAAMRDAMKRAGGDPNQINPLQPVDLVIDHSVQVDHFGSPDALAKNAALEFHRNNERYRFLRWGQRAFTNFRVVPPATGIVHQVNLEYLAHVAFVDGDATVYPDTLVGTDSHTTMINGIGVLGWGVGGIEAEAAMLGQPVSMLIPDVVGFRLHGALPASATATDTVLTVTEMLRQKGVVGKFVEFFGPGLARLPLADRATIANMCPEYGATAAYFPIDKETLRYLRFTNRTAEHVELVEAYFRHQGLFLTPETPEPRFSDQLELDLATVVPSLAGPKRPQDRVPLSGARANANTAIGQTPGVDRSRRATITIDGQSVDLDHGMVVIAAITSCTNTSNPAVMVGAGLLAQKAVARGLTRQPWVKTSLAPGSKVVTDYLREAELLPALEQLGFHVVGYGCTTCIGNSGPLPPVISEAIAEQDLVVASVLSGNRNFEGRVNPQTRLNYLTSPPLVVAYALAGTLDIDLQSDPLGHDAGGQPVFLGDLWPTPSEIAETISRAVHTEQFAKQYDAVFVGDEQWRDVQIPSGEFFNWDANSTYVRQPPFFADLSPKPEPLSDIRDARVLVMLGDTVTTDHISPAGAIPPDGPAARYLIEHGVAPADFNSFGSRRGNHEVMMRGTFGNIRLRNQLVPGVEGGVTMHFPTGSQMSIFDAATKYQADRIPLVALAGKEYGTGSSRDWAAKGTRLLGVRAVIARSFERIHRSNLVGMGVLPLQLGDDMDWATLGIDGTEVFDLRDLAENLRPGSRIEIQARNNDGRTVTIPTIVRIDTDNEMDYFCHGGILKYVLRELLRKEDK